MSTEIVEKESGQSRLNCGNNTTSEGGTQALGEHEKLEDSSKAEVQNKLDTMSYRVVHGDIDDLDKLENHARQTPRCTERLEESIRHKGIINLPKAVKTKSGRPKLFDGWSCTIAAKNIGLKKISYKLYENLDEDSAANLSYVLNEEQQSLNEIDKAKFVKKFIDKGLSYRQISADLGYGSATTVHNLNQLNSLPESVQSDISHNHLDPTKARQLLKLPNDELREKISKKIQRQKLSVPQAKEAVKDELEQLEKQEHGLEDVQNQATEFPDIFIRHQPKMSQEVEHESADSAVIIIPSADRLGCHSRHDLQKFLKAQTEMIVDTASAINKGGNVAVLSQDVPDSRPGMSFAPSTIILPYISEILRRRNVDMVGRVTVQINNPFLLGEHRNKLSEQDHTQFSIRNDTVNVVFFRKGEGRDTIPQESIEQSILSEDQLFSLTDCVWFLEVNDDELPQSMQIICDKIIRLSTFVGDTVLFPLCFNCHGIAAAHSLGRKVIGYFNEPDYRRNPLVEIFGEPKSVTISPLLDSVTSYLDSAPSTPENSPKDIAEIKEMTADQSA